jgi:hypothetical protein
MGVRALALLLLCACSVRPTPDPKPVPDAGCAAACDNQREHRCKGGEPTEDGYPCEAVCKNAEDLLPGSYHTPCVAGAGDCAEVDECFR